MPNVIIGSVIPDDGICIGKSTPKRIMATGLMEPDLDGNMQPKRGLVFGILTNDGQIEDTLFDITHTPTDEIKLNYFPTTITVPRGHGSIIPGQRRDVFIKHRDEVISAGLCPAHSTTCHILAAAVLIVQED